jgi:putative hemolysin
MKQTAIVLVVLLVALTGCARGDDDPEIANPASVYCEEQGGTLEMREGEGGTVGICVFDDGSECEEWAFFRGECSAADR